MKKRTMSLILILGIIFALFTGCGETRTTDSAGSVGPSAAVSASAGLPDETAPGVELYVSAAASLTEAMNEIAEMYEKEMPGVAITLNFAASGTLQKQIEEGADCDVFLSAAQKQMDALEEEGLIDTSSRIDLLENKVVLIAPKNSTLSLTGFEDCLSDKVTMIGLGDPESVPAGQYAKEVFTYLNGWDTIAKKANLGSDVKAVLSWVETGNVDCGVVYSTDAATSENIRVVAEAPAGSHTPIIYPAAGVSAGKNEEAAQKFLEFLQTEEANRVFLSYGFSIAG